MVTPFSYGFVTFDTAEEASKVQEQVRLSVDVPSYHCMRSHCMLELILKYFKRNLNYKPLCKQNI